MNTNNEKKLTDEQLLKLNKIKNSINNSATNTSKFLGHKKLNFKFTLNKRNKSICILIIAVFIVICFNLNMANTKIMNQDSKTEYEGSIVNVSMNKETNKLTYDVGNISIKGKNNYLNISNCNWVKFDVNTVSDTYTVNNEAYIISKNLSLFNLDIKPDTVYIQYNNAESTASKEIIFASQKPNDIDLTGVEKVTSRFYEKSNPIQVKSYINSYDNSFLMTAETLAGGELITKSLKHTLSNIEDSITFSDKNNTSKITLNFSEIGMLDLSKIDEIKESPEVIYTEEDGVLRIKNSKQNIDYMYITHIGNENVMCKAEDLVATTDKRVFLHQNFDVENDIGYKTLVLKSDNNVYVIKFNSLYYESLQNELFKQLGIENNLKIKKVQKVIDYNSNGCAGVIKELGDILN